MKKVLFCTLASAAMLGGMAQKTAKVAVKATAPVSKSLLDSFSYAAGYNVATNMKEQGITELNAEMMKRGIDDYFKKKTPLIAPELGNQCLQRQLDIFAKAKAVTDKIKADADKAVGVAFLEANKKRPGVITLPDGLQYEVIKVGDSVAHIPTAADTVVVNYIGTQMNGVEFDNSYKRGQPAVFAIGRVIKGWAEILQLMRVGAQWKVYIPTELAYGNNPPPGSGIVPGAPLIFDMSLEGIKRSKAKAEQ